MTNYPSTSDLTRDEKSVRKKIICAVAAAARTQPLRRACRLHLLAFSPLCSVGVRRETNEEAGRG